MRKYGKKLCDHGLSRVTPQMMGSVYGLMNTLKSSVVVLGGLVVIVVAIGPKVRGMKPG
jgi:hypothetical protein